MEVVKIKCSNCGLGEGKVILKTMRKTTYKCLNPTCGVYFDNKILKKKKKYDWNEYEINK